MVNTYGLGQVNACDLETHINTLLEQHPDIPIEDKIVLRNFQTNHTNIFIYIKIG